MKFLILLFGISFLEKMGDNPLSQVTTRGVSDYDKW